MKIVPNRVFIILAVFFLQQTTVFAAGPPPPSSPPPPPGLSLDSGTVVFVVISILFGMYKLNKILNKSRVSN